jgi:hypothetical protein
MRDIFEPPLILLLPYCFVGIFSVAPGISTEIRITPETMLQRVTISPIPVTIHSPVGQTPAYGGANVEMIALTV